MKLRIKFTLMALLVAVAFAFPYMPALAAQGQESRIPPLIAQLKLSDGQKKKLETLYEENARKIKAIREDASLSDQARKARIGEINDATNKFLSQTLTEKQRAKLKELRKKAQ